MDRAPATLGRHNGCNFELSGICAVVPQTHLNQDFAGTPVGLCIMKVFQFVHVPPFTGKAQTLTGSFLISP